MYLTNGLKMKSILADFEGHYQFKRKQTEWEKQFSLLSFNPYPEQHLPPV